MTQVTAFGATIGDPLDANDDAIAVHRLIQVAPGDVDVACDLFERPIRNHEAKPSGVGRDPADDEIHAIRQAVPVAPGLYELAAGDQLPEQALERGTLFARKLEPLEQLTRGGGVVDLVANQLQ